MVMVESPENEFMQQSLALPYCSDASNFSALSRSTMDAMTRIRKSRLAYPAG